MRIRRCLLACLVFTVASNANAIARGGLGGNVGLVLEGIFVIAIVGGVLAGALCALSCAVRPGKALHTFQESD